MPIRPSASSWSVRSPAPPALGGMAGGQMLDLAAEGRFGAQKHGADDVQHAAGDEDRRAAAFRLRGRRHSRRRDKPQRTALERYGSAVGEAFQIADDLLDIEGDPALVGKQTGKDAAAGKATFVSVLGVDGAKARLRELVAEAEAALAPFGAGRRRSSSKARNLSPTGMPSL